MKKILIALESSFTAQALQENLFKEGFHVAKTNNGKEALDIIRQAPPDLILADANLPEMDAFELLDNLQKEERTKRIPFIVFSRTGSEYHREKAMDHEAKDFVVGLSDSPREVTLKIKSHLGEQKIYTFKLSSEEEDSIRIARDLSNLSGTKCPSCNSELSLHLLRNLSLGKNTFNASLVCPRCSFRKGSASE